MRRLKEELNYLCTCGHFRRQHDGDDYANGCLIHFMRLGYCQCNEYKQDNLLYLEKLVKEGKNA